MLAPSIHRGKYASDNKQQHLSKYVNNTTKKMIYICNTHCMITKNHSGIYWHIIQCITLLDVYFTNMIKKLHLSTYLPRNALHPPDA